MEAGEQQSGQETVTAVAGEDSRDFRAVEGVELTDLFVVRRRISGCSGGGQRSQNRIGRRRGCQKGTGSI